MEENTNEIINQAVSEETEAESIMPRRSRRGLFPIIAGLTCILAAASLYIYNMWDSKRAGEESTEVYNALIEVMPTPYAWVPKVATPTPDPSTTRDPNATPKLPLEPDPTPFTITTFDPAAPVGREDYIPDYILNPHMEMPWIRIKGYDYIAVLQIPSEGLEVPVMRDWSYQKLRRSPCRYSGSAYLDNLVIAAHNYEQHFGKLRSLSEGTKVILTDMDSNVFRYTVREILTLQPSQSDVLLNEEWDLTLFTCSIGGATRVVVRCSKDG